MSEIIKIKMKSKEEMKLILDTRFKKEQPKLERLSGKFVDLVKDTKQMYDKLIEDFGDKVISVTKDINCYRFYTSQTAYIPIDSELVLYEIKDKEV